VNAGPAADELDPDALDLPISALEHYSYCPRQCALIHVEQTFDENIFTVRGQIAHERVDTVGDTIARGLKIVRAMPVWSERLGLQGKADLVEYRESGPYPVEYKLGKRHGVHADVQLCAQALCLEEMLGVDVPQGAIFYHALRRRHEVQLDAPLRDLTLRTIEGVRAILQAQRLPPAPNDARCPNCSLLNACLPHVIAEPHRVRGQQGALFRPLHLSEEVEGA